MTRAPVPDLATGERSLGGSVAHYLARVLRLRAGDAFVAFDPASGLEADAVTVWADGEVITVRFGPLREGRARTGRAITLVQGFAKGDKCDAVVRDATELGVTRILVAVTQRSIVRLDEDKAGARRARWARIAEDAARQCGRADSPLVERPQAWGEALGAVAQGCARFCLYEHATEPLGPALFEALACGADLAFACGPEGGLEATEVEVARASGWAVASLGPLALRTETVAAAVLGAVRVWSGLTQS